MWKSKFEIWKLGSQYGNSQFQPSSKYEKLKYESSKYENLLESSKLESSKVWNYEIIHGLSFVIIFVFPDSVATV